MHLPKEKILLNSPFRRDLETLINYAERAFRQRKPIWTPFLSPQLIEEVERKLNNIYDLKVTYEGGFPNAERKKICFSTSDEKEQSSHKDIPLKGIYLKGNFLFDRAKPDDFRHFLNELDVEAEEIGDIWLIRDRGAQAICSRKSANSISQKIGKLREVEVKIEAFDVSDLELPFKRPEKVIYTVEASTRVDAIASAGFGLSRSKTTNKIKQGCLRLNWEINAQPSKSLAIGDLIHLEKKGSLKILDIDKTKKDRWRIKLLRQ